MYTNKWIPLTEEQKADYVCRMRDNMEMLRAKAHLSQTGLGNILGLARQTISMMESGSSAISWSRYLTMAFFFGTCEDTRETVRDLGIVPSYIAVGHEPGREITKRTATEKKG